MTAVAFTSNSGLGPLPRLLEAAGGPRLVARVLQAENLPLGIIADGNWMPLRAVMGLFERAATELGDEFLGLRVGQGMQPEDFGLWVRYAVSAPTLRGMLHRADRAVRFHQSHAELRLHLLDGVAIWRYRAPENGVVGRRHHAEHALWPMVTALSRYTSARVKPIRIECSYDRPRCWRRLEEAFEAPVVFGKDANAVVFDPNLLDEPVSRKSPLETQITCRDLRRIARRHPPATIVDAARAVLEVRIAEPATDIDGTALLLGISPRSLQRHLSEANLSFRDLLEQVRMQRALDLLHETQASITEIAFTVGYNDITSFSRAFRRWAGFPPNHVRRAPPRD